MYKQMNINRDNIDRVSAFVEHRLDKIGIWHQAALERRANNDKSVPFWPSRTFYFGRLCSSFTEKKTATQLESRPPSVSFSWIHLCIMTWHGYVSVKFLLAQDGIDVNIKNNWGRTALQLAAETGYLDKINILLDDHGASTTWVVSK